MKIRALRTLDKDHVIQVINFVCAECKWMLTNKFDPTPQWLHALEDVECKFHVLLLYVDNDKPIGWCRIFPEKCVSPETIGELGIGLLPNFRNQKLGSELLETALESAFNIGMSRIDLSVHQDNKKAVFLFEKFGFIHTANSENRLLMSVFK